MTELEIIEAFVDRVNARAEANIEKTNKLEGSHYAAMMLELQQLRNEQNDVTDKPISMKDKLPPEYGKRYHVFDHHSMGWTYAYWTSDAHQGGHFETEIGLYVYASHWVPEPEWPEGFR